MREQWASGLSDAIIVNTCAVTAEAEKQARQTIRKARRDYQCKIIVTGYNRLLLKNGLICSVTQVLVIMTN